MTMRSAALRPSLSILLLLAATAFAQSPAPSSGTPPSPEAKAGAGRGDTASLGALAWLAGCWRGEVNRRDFREQWMPLRGNLMLGVSQPTLEGQTLDFEYLRLEPRADGVYYVAVPSGKGGDEFRLSDVAREDDATLFTFSASGRDFPQRIIYRRGGQGWLYVHVEGVVNGSERKVIYPMRRIGCESGELIEQ